MGSSRLCSVHPIVLRRRVTVQEFSRRCIFCRGGGGEVRRDSNRLQVQRGRFEWEEIGDPLRLGVRLRQGKRCNAKGAEKIEGNRARARRSEEHTSELQS